MSHPRHWMPLALLVVLAIGLPGSIDGASRSPAPPPGEPGVDLSVAARLLSVSGDGATRRAVVELSLVSRIDLESLGLEQRDDRAGTAAPVAIPAAADGLRPLSLRKVRASIDLEAGELHHILFRAEGRTRAGRMISATTWLRLDLDPARAPERPEGLIQYRAVKGGR